MPTFPWGPPHPMLTLDPRVTNPDIPSPCPDQGLDSDTPPQKKKLAIFNSYCNIVLDPWPPLVTFIFLNTPLEPVLDP